MPESLDDKLVIAISSGEGKFCNNCGANLSLVECENCGTKSPAGTRFCGECGNRLE